MTELEKVIEFVIDKAQSLGASRAAFNAMFSKELHYPEPTQPSQEAVAFAIDCILTWPGRKEQQP